MRKVLIFHGRHVCTPPMAAFQPALGCRPNLGVLASVCSVLNGHGTVYGSRLSGWDPLSHTQLLPLRSLGQALEDLAEVREAKGGQWVGLGWVANRNGPCSLSRQNQL